METLCIDSPCRGGRAVPKGHFCLLREGVFSTVTPSPLKKRSERMLCEHADVGYESKVFLILPGSFLSTRLRSAQIWCGSGGVHQGVSGGSAPFRWGHGRRSLSWRPRPTIK